MEHVCTDESFKNTGWLYLCQQHLSVDLQGWNYLGRLPVQEWKVSAEPAAVAEFLTEVRKTSAESLASSCFKRDGILQKEQKC